MTVPIRKTISCRKCDKSANVDQPTRFGAHYEAENIGWEYLIPPNEGPAIYICPDCDLLEFVKNRDIDCETCGVVVNNMSVKGIRDGYTGYGSLIRLKVRCSDCGEIYNVDYDIL